MGEPLQRSPHPDRRRDVSLLLSLAIVALELMTWRSAHALVGDREKCMEAGVRLAFLGRTSPLCS